MGVSEFFASATSPNRSRQSERGEEREKREKKKENPETKGREKRRRIQREKSRERRTRREKKREFSSDSILFLSSSDDFSVVIPITSSEHSFALAELLSRSDLFMTPDSEENIVYSSNRSGKRQREGERGNESEKQRRKTN